ncbi:MAG: TraR/DksA C4-type zinc finger protein [Chloroflexota bacterium]|nr:TraR/DksA C4-type zinc finger protein [Chloroflexota bacterium]
MKGEKLPDKTEILKQELDELQAQIAALETALESKPEYGLGKGDPAITQRELDRELLQRFKKRAAHLRQAMSQNDAGTYGICAQCGNPIHPERLAVLPGTQVCVHCAQRETGQK